MRSLPCNKRSKTKLSTVTRLSVAWALRRRFCKTIEVPMTGDRRSWETD